MISPQKYSKKSLPEVSQERFARYLEDSEPADSLKRRSQKKAESNSPHCTVGFRDSSTIKQLVLIRNDQVHVAKLMEEHKQLLTSKIEIVQNREKKEPSQLREDLQSINEKITLLESKVLQTKARKTAMGIALQKVEKTESKIQTILIELLSKYNGAKES